MLKWNVYVTKKLSTFLCRIEGTHMKAVALAFHVKEDCVMLREHGFSLRQAVHLAENKGVSFSVLPRGKPQMGSISSLARD